MIVDDDIVDLLVEIINLTGEYIDKQENNDIEYDETLISRYRRMVISGYIYAKNLEELIRDKD